MCETVASKLDIAELTYILTDTRSLMSNDESPSKCPNLIVGSMLRVVHCEGAWDTFIEALNSVSASKRDSVKTQMDLLVKRLSDGEGYPKTLFRLKALFPVAPEDRQNSFTHSRRFRFELMVGFQKGMKKRFSSAITFIRTEISSHRKIQQKSKGIGRELR